MVRSVPVRSIFWLVVCFQISNQKYCLLLKELNKFPFPQLVWGCVCRPELIGAAIQPSHFFFLMYCLLAWSVLGSQDTDTTPLSLQSLQLTCHSIHPHHYQSLTSQKDSIFTPPSNHTYPYIQGNDISQ